MELKPCPFCGGKAKMAINCENQAYVLCTNRSCGARVWADSNSQDEAAEMWNRRVTMDNNTTGEPTANSTTYSQYCSFRLPCGVCTRTNSICPLGSGWTAWWQTPQGQAVPTITTQTGTGVTLNTKDYMATGETTAKCDMSQYEHGEWKKGE